MDDSIRWSRTNWSNFCSDGVLIASVDSLLEDSVALTRLLVTPPYRAPFVSKVTWSYEIERAKTHQLYDGIVAAYNGTGHEYSQTLGKPTCAGEVNNINLFYAGRVRGHATNLGKGLQEALIELGRVMHNFSTEYTRTEYREVVGNFIKFGALVQKSSGDIANKNMFHLTQ